MVHPSWEYQGDGAGTAYKIGCDRKEKNVTASNNICRMASYIRYRHIILDDTPKNGRGQKHLIVYAASASNI
jgi:hypothetical protein